MSILSSILVPDITNLLIKATLLLMIGWGASLVLRRAPAGARHLAWLLVITGVLLLPVLTRVAPVRLPLLPGAAAHSQAGIPVTANASSPVATSTATGLSTRRPGLGVLVLGIWLTVASLLLLRIAFSQLSVRRMRRAARRLDSPGWKATLGEVAQRLKLPTPPPLFISDQVEVAFASNAVSPAILLPSFAEEWTEERRRAVLLHELAHVRRRDLLGHAVARIACAVYWFHPLVWMAARRLRAESELACDDMVLNNGMPPSAYAQHLLDLVLAIGPGRGAPAAVLPLVRRHEFEGRLLAILDRAAHRESLGAGSMRALSGILGLSVMSIAVVVPVRRAPAAPLAVSTAAMGMHELPGAAPQTNQSVPPVGTRRRHAGSPVDTGTAAPVDSSANEPAPMLIRVHAADSTYLLKAEQVQSECSAECQQQFAQQRQLDSLRRANLPPGGAGFRVGVGGRGAGGFLPGGAGRGRPVVPNPARTPPDSAHTSKP